MKDEQQTNNLSALQVSYLESMQRGSGRAADQVVQQALDSGTLAGDVYLNIFQPTAYAIGRLWQNNQFSVAQEHLATAIIERQMGELHPLFRPPQPRPNRPHTLVIGCVPNEQHRVGARMVADFFEADGWEVHYLGAAVPLASLVEMAKELQADLIGLSAQMIYHVPHISEFAHELNRHSLDNIPVMVGGMPFVQQPELGNTLNVRFSAADARQAVDRANRLFAAPGATAAPPHPPQAVALATLEACQQARERIIQYAANRALERDSEVAGLGSRAEQIITAGFEFTTHMLETAMALQNTTLLEQQLARGNQRRPHDGITPAHLLNRFRLYADAVNYVLPPDQAAAVNQYVHWMIARQQEIVDQSRNSNP